MRIDIEKKRMLYFEKMEKKYEGKKIVFGKSVVDYEMQKAVEELAQKFNLTRC